MEQTAIAHPVPGGAHRAPVADEERVDRPPVPPRHLPHEVEFDTLLIAPPSEAQPAREPDDVRVNGNAFVLVEGCMEDAGGRLPTNSRQREEFLHGRGDAAGESFDQQAACLPNVPRL